LDTTPEEALLYSKDLKADLVFEDTAATHIVICQCKYQPFDKPVDEGDVNDFFSRHGSYMDTEWVRKHGSADAGLALNEYKERVESGFTVSLYFVSTGTASERIVRLAERATQEYAKHNIPVTCELLDFTRLKDYYVRSLSLEESVPERVSIDLPSRQFFEKKEPHRTIVAVIKGNTLRNLSKQYKQALYAWNIRGYLGNRGINQDISETASSDPAHFFYFNNGVSAICTAFELQDNKIVAQNFQVINGAQTVSTLANLEPNSDVEVLFRLTLTQNVKTEKGLNRQIIQYNNSQNLVRVSDFRSNDEIQLFLERELPDTRANGPLPKLKYIRKRAVGRQGYGIGIKLEELAKIRYSWLYEPTIAHSSPKALWTPKDDGGVYEKAFGVDDELQPAWSAATLDECRLAITCYLRFDDTVGEIIEKKPEMRFLKRLRFHALALAGAYFRKSFTEADVTRLLKNKEVFDQFWVSFWATARSVLIDVFSQAEDEGSTMFAFVRSTERWAQMTKRFDRHIAAL
jgi:hypothetical protein